MSLRSYMPQVQTKSEAGATLASDKSCILPPPLSFHLPQIISSADFLVTGTLGLAQPSSRAAVEAAVAAARSGSCPSTGGAAPLVLVDVNWRPVFWKDPTEAKKTIEEFVMRSADVVKITVRSFLF